MCIRDSADPACAGNPAPASVDPVGGDPRRVAPANAAAPDPCLLYTSDAADERSSVDLGGRRIIKKKTRHDPVADTCRLSEIVKHEQTAHKNRNITHEKDVHSRTQ